ncbi:MAG: cadherin-like beta sandwich domain-containing protein, partial [Aestuariibacter sp.]|nr:cadherin-like beta sandwich domain-containing protein [Aestuariibacter sp.]
SDIQLSARELDQIFQASSLEYTAIVGYLAKSIQITASAESENATITTNGVETASGVASDSISLGAAALVLKLPST